MVERIEQIRSDRLRRWSVYASVPFIWLALALLNPFVLGQTSAGLGDICYDAANHERMGKPTSGHGIVNHVVTKCAVRMLL